MAEVTGHGRQKRSSGDSRNSIMNYFSKSQNKSQNANDQYFPSKDVIGINELSVIYDEVDEYRRRLRGEKKAELSVVNGKGKPKKNANGFASDEEEQDYHNAQNMPKV